MQLGPHIWLPTQWSYDIMLNYQFFEKVKFKDFGAQYISGVRLVGSDMVV